MYTLVLVLHFIACIFLIMLILMQSGKGSAAGIFGSSNSDSVFAGPTATTFITYSVSSLKLISVMSKDGCQLLQHLNL